MHLDISSCSVLSPINCAFHCLYIQASLLLVSTPCSHVASNHFATRPQATITAAIVAASKASEEIGHPIANLEAVNSVNHDLIIRYN